MINRHIKEHPGISTPFAINLLAYCAYKEKDYPEALEILKRNRSRSWGLKNYLKAWIYLKLDDPQLARQEFFNLNSLPVGYLGNFFLCRKLRLQNQVFGPQSALRAIKHFPNYKTSYPEVQLEIARIYHAAGDTKKSQDYYGRPE